MINLKWNIYQIIDCMTVLLMADQNKLKPYLYIIPCINSYINFDIKNQKLFMFCYKCTEFLLNVFWAPVLLCWAVVKLGGGHNCTTGPEKNIGVCRRMGGGGRLVPARARDRMPGSYPSPLQSTHTKFSDHGPATAGCCWDKKKTEKMSTTSIATEGCAVYSVLNNRGTGSGPPHGTMRH